MIAYHAQFTPYRPLYYPFLCGASGCFVGSKNDGVSASEGVTVLLAWNSTSLSNPVPCPQLLVAG
jgi:hypothetical protein